MNNIRFVYLYFRSRLVIYLKTSKYSFGKEKENQIYINRNMDQKRIKFSD